MHKVLLVFVAALSLVTVTGCKKKGGGGEALAKLEGFSKSMCECKDKACADKVQADMTKWSEEQAKQASGKEADKPDPELTKKMTDASTKLGECYAKVAMPAAPDTAAPTEQKPAEGAAPAAPADPKPEGAAPADKKPDEGAAAPADKKPDEAAKGADDKKPADGKAGGW
jgi:hypothetical protein